MKTILVVEDDETNRELASRFLKREGYRVVCAVNGLEGVQLATELVPSLILMDLSLPELDGWEATRRIKANPITARIPIIALTAHAMVEDVVKAREAGCDVYETKPVNYTRLMAKIETMVEGSK